MQRVLNVLEFDKIKDQLLTHAASSLGKELIQKLTPMFDLDEVVKAQDETDEAVKVLRLKGNVPLGGIFDIRQHVKRAQIGGMLGAVELLDISSTMYGCRQFKQFIQAMLDDEVELPLLEVKVNDIYSLVELERSIKNCIDDHGVVMDGASDKLRSIRQELRSTEARIRDKLENMTRSSSTQKMLSDAIITIRNDRYVLPVKQEYRGSFGGMVHDQSSSGATLFIEPQAVVELNNRLREARIKEKLEIDRILTSLSNEVAEDADLIFQNVSIISMIDFIFAKGHYGQRLKASMPKMNNNGYVKINRARHPLIPIEEVVPSDIEIGKDYSTIVITGPNTGGKTVTLKTIGLLTLMAQSGLQIPALDGSEIAIFRSIYADIGDEQSIEQSLSTFSSHMTNIVDILKRVDSRSLVLFDELGAGTDPQEGAALAISILDNVHEKGARVVATTHYPELKAYGYNRNGVINASVEFDVETLRPTYRLLIGVPGRSNAFEISRRLGLDLEIINKAKQQISAESNEVENMIGALEASKRKSDKEMLEAEALRKEAEKLHHELQQQIIEFNRERDRLYEKAEEKAKEAVAKAKKEAEDIIKNLRQIQKQQHSVIKEHELIDAKRALEEATPELGRHQKGGRKKQAKKQINLLPGDEVKVISLDKKGHVVSKQGNNEYQIQIGIMKMKAKVSDLEYIGTPKEVETRPIASVKGSQHHVKPELDLRGERFEEALHKLEKYVDDAILAGYPSVSIIHGKGTGALRKGVSDFAQSHRLIKGVRLGGMSEGGSGVTILELK